MFKLNNWIQRTAKVLVRKNKVPSQGDTSTQLRGRSPLLSLITPHKHFFEGEPLQIQLLPADGEGEFEIEIKSKSGKNNEIKTIQAHQLKLSQGLRVDGYRIRARWRPTRSQANGPCWSNWSKPLVVRYHPASDEERVWGLRIREHRLSLMCDQDENGVRTLTDPWAMPPNCPLDEPVKWFRTPAFEGSTVLLNEESDYYRDPLIYYLECIGELLDRGVEFRTWHDLLDGRFGGVQREVILQFDMDAGVLSMARLIPLLCERGVRASIMIHRSSQTWYEYRLDDMDLSVLKDAEAAGWTLGYHNNTLTTLQGYERPGDYTPEIVRQAQAQICDDVRFLQSRFNIRVYNHHGGNVLNKKVPLPPELKLVCVDKPCNAKLWRPIRSSFSDGGFFARPDSMRQKVKELAPGMHFFRNHPVKYANYAPPFDIAPLAAEDAERAGAEPSPELHRRIEVGLQRQQVWLRQRDRYRLGNRLNYAGPFKPISGKFADFDTIRPQVDRLRKRRNTNFLLQYPWNQGDPRVFWWRMLASYVPKGCKTLNVGALPPDQSEENTAFLGSQTRVLQMDIDAARQPDIVGDVTRPDSSLIGEFDAVLLFGLPYVHSPSIAVAACSKLVKPGGIGLFGMAADCHPFRGGRWHPENRPVWRPELEPLTDIGLRASLWSFDDRYLKVLFASWDQVEIEFFSHYWFAVCRKNLS